MNTISRPPNTRETMLIYKNVIDDLIVRYTQNCGRLNTGMLGKKIRKNFDLNDYTTNLYVQFVLDVYFKHLIDIALEVFVAIGLQKTIKYERFTDNFYLYVNYTKTIDPNIERRFLPTFDYHFKSIIVIKYICETTDTKQSKHMLEKVTKRFDRGLLSMEPECRNKILEVFQKNFETYKVMRDFIQVTTFDINESKGYTRFFW